jgi:hypothetical protein
LQAVPPPGQTDARRGLDHSRPSPPHIFKPHIILYRCPAPPRRSPSEIPPSWRPRQNGAAEERDILERLRHLLREDPKRTGGAGTRCEIVSLGTRYLTKSPWRPGRQSERLRSGHLLAENDMGSPSSILRIRHIPFDRTDRCRLPAPLHPGSACRPDDPETFFLRIEI